MLTVLDEIDIEHFAEDGVFQRGAAARFIQLAEVGDDVLFRARHFDGLRGFEHLAQIVTDDGGRRAAGAAIALNAPAGRLADRDDDDQRRKDQQRHLRH